MSIEIEQALNNITQALTQLADYSEKHEYDQQIDKIYEFVCAAQKQLVALQEQDELVIGVAISND